MNILVISQARVSSSRLPGKVLLPLGRGSVLDLHLKRIKKSKKITDFMVATTAEPGAADIVKIATAQGFAAYRGSLEDVLDRYYQAAHSVSNVPEVIVRVTSDCPLVEVEFIDDLIQRFLDSGADYASNCLTPNLPDGLDVEVMKFSALNKAWSDAKLPSEREHVTAYIWKNSDIKGGILFKGLAVDYGLGLEGIRLTLDQKEDYEVITQIVNNLGEDCHLNDILNFLKSRPDILEMNSKILMNEGYLKSLAKDSRK